MCEKAFEEEPWYLEYVCDRLKTQEMCNEAVSHNPFTLRFIPDWLITKQQPKTISGDHCNNIWFIKWYEGYQKRKAQKAQFKIELTPIPWHPSRWWDWCVPEDEKQETEKLWA